MNNFRKINLQLFADDGGLGGDGAENKEANEQTYTLEELEKAKEELKKELEEKHIKELENTKKDILSEAERLSKLTKEQKQAEEYEKLKKELEELRLDKQRSALKDETLKQLSEQNLSDKFLAFVFDDDAQKIKDKISSLKSLFDEQVQKQVEERLKGKTPQTGTGSTLTKESILSIENDEERVNAIRENLHLFN